MQQIKIRLNGKEESIQMKDFETIIERVIVNEIASLNEEKQEKVFQDMDIKKGALHKALGIPEDEKIPMSLINKEIKKIENKYNEDEKMSAEDRKMKRRLELAKTFKQMNEEFENKKYILTVQHDNGKIKFSTAASSEEQAKQIVMKAEGCPESAIIKVEVAKPIIKEEDEEDTIIAKGYGDISELLKNVEHLTDINNHTGASMAIADYFNEITGMKNLISILTAIETISDIEGHNPITEYRNQITKRILKLIENNVSKEIAEKIYQAL